ncbi:MAG: heat-inducible transcriptional repressor HrcA [Pseudomonadota bacterium]
MVKPTKSASPPRPAHPQDYATRPVGGRGDGPISRIDKRSREIFRLIVDNYFATGDPVGSRTLARQMNHELSAATIRNTMADLEEIGLLCAPHVSAGRIPTEQGLRLFVDGLLEVTALPIQERDELSAQAGDSTLHESLSQTIQTLSGLSHCVSLVTVPARSGPLKHIEIAPLSSGQALVILVSQDGTVENRLISVPPGITSAQLHEASRYLQARVIDSTLQEMGDAISAEIASGRSELDTLTQRVVEQGIAEKLGDDNPRLIVRGHSHLLNDVHAVSDLETIQKLFDAFETQDTALKILDAAASSDGVHIFMGSDNPLFHHAGCSLVISGYRGHNRKVLGAIGVIGPMRLNYARIIPMVDYTAKMIERAMTTDVPIPQTSS